ncbi:MULTISPECIES: ABC transporter ATP-binding protein [Vibrio]|uniref:ABC transporter ATP-binding protein n=2 Tax=Vibrio TaxID=662 RepID=A0AAN0NCF9_9VIBR|nr:MULTISPECIES: ABC transporter ATP-binding protein [Vibrio]KNH11235.1 ABC transporter permease [Vibrio lentus]KAA8599102.1 Heterodimeric efflux ABC transporter permease/ATP-binding subunit 2 [Vibrio cyclitrophicus]MBE8556567.1 ABC transporter ATP-binding protein [Vibrio sp. OPT24]MBU2932363.1 ABC transporter ATP-binding protein/permease [Vibrio cyclitrophicus]NOH44631.1 ABC transporter ATP-binding protein [Vibrio cyclitrophicus]|tara:strand:- start:517 stop:2286 length:1770 start_codon:yes stop_codon:yes gene_type:complete
MLKGVDLKYLKHFFKFAKKYKGSAILGIAMLPLSVITSLLFPWLIIQVIDVQLSHGDMDGLLEYVFYLVVVLVASYVVDTTYSYNLRKTGQYTITDMRSVLFARVLKLPRSYFDNTPIGVTLSRLTSDLETIGETFVQSVVGLVKDSINTIALLVMMFFIDWQLTLIVLVIMPPVMYLTVYVRNRLRALYKVTRSTLARGIGFLQEVLFGMKTVQMYRAEEQVEKRYQGYTDEFLRAQKKINKYDAILFSFISGITSVTIAIMIWYGSEQVIEGALTLGVLIAFINTLEKVFVPIRDFTSQIASIQSSFAAFDHIEELFVEPTEEEGRNLLPSNKVEKQLEQFVSLEFKNVSFRYKDDSPYVLKNVSFVLQKGHQIALVGSTGSGKSTILRLISKTYQDYQGSILLNGIELSQISSEDSAHLFSMMMQDVHLFEESIQFNIALGKAHLSRTDVEQAARYVYADKFIEQLPQGYDFHLEKNGSNLSVGQTQLISFARAVAQGGQLMMLDEATSSVDSITEDFIQKAMQRLFKEKTVIAIAHRLSTVRHSDTILVLDKGQVVEQGNHQQLVIQNGVYAGLLKESIVATNDS